MVHQRSWDQYEVSLLIECYIICNDLDVRYIKKGEQHLFKVKELFDAADCCSAGGDFNKIIILLIKGVIYYGFPISTLVSVERLKRPIRVLKRD